MKTIKKYNLLLIFICLLVSCATYKKQVDNVQEIAFPSNKNIIQTFYLIGDAGNASNGQSTPGLDVLKTHLKNSKEEDYTIFLGDNIYPSGMPKKKSPKRELAEHRLDAQLDALVDFKGKTIFIPGNHDWYAEGLPGLKRQKDYIQKKLDDKDAFRPNNFCGIEEIDISDDVHLIVIDSQWFLANWDNHPTINDNCEIKTREQFYAAFEDALSDEKDKTTLIAMHHPVMTYGPHGGQFGFDKNIYPISKKIPLPLIGTLMTHIRKSGGVSIQDRINERYNEFADRLLTMARSGGKVIFTSGHEHSLQYNQYEGIPVIVSGSGSKESATKLVTGAKFTYGKQGFARLDVLEDGSSWVRYYTNESKEPVFQTEIYKPNPLPLVNELMETIPASVQASVYDYSETDKTGFYEGFWGEKYREVYGKKVTATTAVLDTLYGGLTPVSEGGGHQSKTLRLMDKDSTIYNMRALRKSAVKFLQTVVFKDKYIESSFQKTLPEKMLLDFYTAAYPYASFVVADMAESINVKHTTPRLFYVPKQPALGKYNVDYGDELYMIEVKADNDNLHLDDFGNPDDIESTDDLFKRLRKDEKYVLDEDDYIRARLFDMVLGDWDRHQDQWRWAEFKEDSIVRFSPIPRDRDQAFSNFDGGVFAFLRTFMSSLKMFRKDGPTIKSPEWFNIEPMPLDRVLLHGADRNQWKEQADFIKNHLTDQVIDNAFDSIPKEIREIQLPDIKRNLRARRDGLVKIAEDYVKKLNELVIITGTDKDDFFEIVRNGNGETAITVYRIKDGEKGTIILKRAYNRKITKEIWVYGLDDDDVFEVSGSGKSPIKIRLIGGQNHDIFDLQRGSNVKVYDHKTKKNTIKANNGGKIKLTDDYNINIFERTRNISTSTTILPSLGFNPDDGVALGFKITNTKNGFERNPFTTRQAISFNYFFATSGFNAAYNGEVTNVIGRTNLVFGANLTSNNFAQNFFGFGSDTPNFDDDLEFDFNRVRLSQFGGHIGLKYNSKYGSNFIGKIEFKSVEVEETPDRFITAIQPLTEDFFERKFFGTATVGYKYESYDVKVNPSRGLKFDLLGGYTVNFSNEDRSFGFLNPEIVFYNRLTSDKKLVLKTAARGQFNFGDDFEFYQAATLGANNGLRGYRLQRFAGERSLVFNGDLRYTFNQFKTSFVPLQIGIYGGYDYGRVWVDNDPNNAWQNSYGGGFWLNSVNIISTQFGLFTSNEGLRFSFVFGLSF